MDILNSVEFVNYDKRFLNNSYNWLTDPEIKYLTASSDIDRNEQEDWFMNLCKRKDYYIRGVQYKGKPIGAVGIKNLSADSGEYWGYIGEKDYWGKGIGKLMILQMTMVARDFFLLKRLHLKVLQDNKRAIGLYEKMGFITVSNDGRFLLMTLDL